MLLRPGAVKPPIGWDRVDWTHPFARKMLFGAWFNHGAVNHTLGAGNAVGQDFVPTWGSVAPRTVTNNGATWPNSNREGGCARFTTSNNIDFGADPISTTHVTICLIRRKTDSTNRISYTFGQSVISSPFADRCATHLPFNDGVVYWDFGGATSGTTRLSVSGLSFSTTIPERWIFIAGPRGMAIWQNGVKVGSHATANPGRTADTSRNFLINLVNGTAGNEGDNQDVNFFMAIDDQWDDSLCRWWSAEPYAHLYQPARRVYADFGAAAASAIPVMQYSYRRRRA